MEFVRPWFDSGLRILGGPDSARLRFDDCGLSSDHALGWVGCRTVFSRVLRVWIAAALFSLGYVLSGLSGGNFFFVLLGIGFLAGMGTGFGYLTSLTVPVRLMPARKGLLTGIAAGGFGLAAVVLAFIVEMLLEREWSVLQVFLWIGLVYGALVAVLGFLIQTPPVAKERRSPVRFAELWASSVFRLLTAGIFCGTFAGLLVIGNLKTIGALQEIANYTLVLGVSIFAFSKLRGALGLGTFERLSGSKALSGPRAIGARGGHRVFGMAGHDGCRLSPARRSGGLWFWREFRFVCQRDLTSLWRRTSRQHLSLRLHWIRPCRDFGSLNRRSPLRFHRKLFFGNPCGRLDQPCRRSFVRAAKALSQVKLASY